MTKAGKRLIAAAEEANAIARGEQEPGKLFVPSDVDVKKLSTLRMQANKQLRNLNRRRNR